MPKGKPITRVRKQVYFQQKNIEKGIAFAEKIAKDTDMTYNFSRLLDDYLTNVEYNVALKIACNYDRKHLPQVPGGFKI